MAGTGSGENLAEPYRLRVAHGAGPSLSSQNYCDAHAPRYVPVRAEFRTVCTEDQCRIIWDDGNKVGKPKLLPLHIYARSNFLSQSTTPVGASGRTVQTLSRCFDSAGFGGDRM